MAFSHEDLIRWSVCWSPEKLAARRAFWPDVLTWRWFLDPDRIGQFERIEQVQIFATAIGQLHRRGGTLAVASDVYDGGSGSRAQILESGLVLLKPGQLLALAKRFADRADVGDAQRLELGKRLAVHLDAAEGGGEKRE